MHWRKYFDDRFVGSWDLEGKPEVVVRMREVKVEELRDPATNGTKKKPVLYFEKATKGMVLNKTCASVIAGMYGNDVRKWNGKPITLYVTTCQAFGKQTECIRVREQPPNTQDAAPSEQSPTPVSTPAPQFDAIPALAAQMEVPAGVLRRYCIDTGTTPDDIAADQGRYRAEVSAWADAQT